MFTGLIQALGRVGSMTANGFGARLVIDPQGWAYKPNHGDSIAVNGCCLTHATKKGDNPHFQSGGYPLYFDVIKQTLERTTLGGLKAGDAVNLESCLTPSSPIGGHFVQGHIDGTAVIENIQTAGEYRLRIRTDGDLIKYIVPTGGIAVDGVSLTIAAVDPAACRFEVALIPTTLQLTNLGQRKVGDRVNLEADILVKSAVHYLKNFTGRA